MPIRMMPFILGATILVSSFALHADTYNPADDFAKRLREAQQVAPMSSKDFGENVSLYNGSTEFKAVDISIPGNFDLPVQLGREFAIEGRNLFTRNLGGFGEWNIDIPYIEGTFTKELGWKVKSTNGYDRCSSSAEPDVSVDPNFQAFYYKIWNGNFLHIPGEIDEELLFNSETKTPAMNDGVTRPWITNSLYRAACLPVTKNGYAGEAFIVTSPSGVKYTFDWVVIRDALNVTMYSTVTSNGMKNTYKANRSNIIMLATQVEDRFGNKVKYTYSGDQLTRIDGYSSSGVADGRYIALTYDANGLISSASSNAGVWNYTYATDTSTPYYLGKSLKEVIRPDGMKWVYSTTGTLKPVKGPVDDYVGWPIHCQINGDPKSGSFGYAVTAPSGAKAEYSFTYDRQYRDYVPYHCNDGNPLHEYPEVFNFIDNFFLTSKVISAPGVSSQTWSYNYGFGGGSYFTPTDTYLNAFTTGAYLPPGDSTNWSLGKTVTVIAPDSETRYLFGTQYARNEGRLLSTTTLTKSGIVTSVSNTDYMTGTEVASMPFPSKIGSAIIPSYISPMNGQLRPVRSNTLTQDTVTYTNQVNAFDAFARPIDVTRSNSNGYSKTELTQYVDNTSKWVLGQVGSVADVATGLIEQNNSYDLVTSNLLSKSSFGVLQESYTYNADGTLASVKDGKNNTYTLANWKRGIPQLITAPNTTTQNGVVNDSGWLTSVTNQRGYVTGYGYDAMGRLTSITPPTGDTVAWAGTTLSFAPITTAVYGVPAGGWLHSISRGNYRKETYLDALYRPLVVREYDNANATGTQRFSRKSFDTSNREVFSAYPGINAGVAVGVRTSYDALGRVIATKADSELGVLTTTTEYLAGGGIKVTGPDGQMTTRIFRSLDGPSYDQMMTEVAPGGVTTSISRDVFGKPLTITRTGTDGLSLSKQFAYDSAQRLCMRTEPETGTSIIDYDAAGNVLWAANGQIVASASTCSRSGVLAASKINYSYDALNRITSTDVPSSINDPTVTYLADGAVNSLTNGTAVWNYTYNKLGKPVTETLTLGTRVNTITHAYDTLANEASLTYPSGTNVTYAPNALGQATQAGSYASGMSYRASGFLTGMSYGNGATYTAKPNLRGLPARRLDQMGSTVITDELMAYDANANPVCVRDSTAGNPGSRDFTYDVRNRLIKASAPNQPWVSAQYQYDSMDDMAMARLGTRQYNYGYNTKNQLSEIGTPATAPVATNFALLNCNDYALLADLGSSTGSGGTLTLSPTTLSDGMVDEPYNQALSTSGGTSPYTYAVTSGNLPLGLSLSGGSISGTPQLEVTKTFTITSTDSTGSAGTRSYSLSISGGGGGGGNEPLRVIDDGKSNPGKHLGQLKQEGEITAALAAGDILKYLFTHDAQGRMTQKGAQVYVYDALNRMTQATGKESYIYDGHGRRVQITKTSDGKLNYPMYSLDGKLLLEDNRQLSKRTEYIYAGSRLVAKRIQALSSTGSNSGAASITTIHTDFLGSPVAETNASGAVDKVERFTPYGEAADLALDAGPGFTGHATDVATGLTYMQQRYMDAELGRFLTPDPVGPEEDFVNHFNRYNYAQNNPVKNVDPDGRVCISRMGAPIGKVTGHSGTTESNCRSDENSFKIGGKSSGGPSTRGSRPVKNTVKRDNSLTGEKMQAGKLVGPIDAYIASKDSDKAKEAARNSGLRGIHNGPMDAMRHCTWNCEMTRSIGSEDAKKIADNHEAWGDKILREDNMDLFNNRVGRELGLGSKSCPVSCKNAVDAGDLKVLPEKEW